MLQKSRKSLLVVATALLVGGFFAQAQAREGEAADKAATITQKGDNPQTRPAATTPREEGSAAKDRPHRRHGEGHDALLAKIHPLLKLTPEQEQHWQTLEKEAKATREEKRQQREEHGALFKKFLSEESADPAALLAEHDKKMDARMATHRRVRDRWVAFYNGLTAEQKGVVKNALKEQLAHREARREAWQHKGKGHDADTGK